jgi:hypothetical protein
MSIASLKQLVSVFANCPEDNKNDCVDREKHIQVSELDALKELLTEGNFNLEGYDYCRSEPCVGIAIIAYIHNNRIRVENEMTVGNKAIRRIGSINMDSTNRIYSNSTTTAEKYNATKQLKLISIDKRKAVFSGFGSSTSTEKYYCGTNIKKIITLIDENTFFVETRFNDKKASETTYSRIVS